jgi:hypothetical protein
VKKSNKQTEEMKNTKLGGNVSLIWDEFQWNMAARFQSVLQTEEFADVTLVSKDHSRVRAHRVILAAGSGFFQSVLGGSKHLYRPCTVHLAGVGGLELRALLAFLYTGRAEVPRHLLAAFMAAAATLRLEGLNAGDPAVGDPAPGPGPVPGWGGGETAEEEEPQLETVSAPTLEPDGNDDVEDLFNISSEPKNELHKEVSLTGNASYSCDHCLFTCSRKKELMSHTGEMHREIKRELKIPPTQVDHDGLYPCTICTKRFRDLSNYRRHVNEVHFKILSFCPYCNYTSKHAPKVREHTKAVHLGITWKCDQCEYEGNAANNLHTHKKIKHPI